jgi:peptidylprolyl isomerase
VSEEELRNAYRAREAEYNKPEKIRLSVVLLHAENEAGRTAARNRLKTLKPAAAADFGAIARQHSEDEATKGQGGDLEFLSKDELARLYGPEAADRMFDHAAIGDLEIVDGPRAVLLLKKTGVRRAVMRPLEAVKPQLSREILAQKKSEAFDRAVADMMSKRGVTFDEGALSRIQLEEGTKTGGAK